MIFSHEELDAYRLSELEQREHAKRQLAVVRAQMEELCSGINSRALSFCPRSQAVRRHLQMRNNAVMTD